MHYAGRFRGLGPTDCVVVTAPSSPVDSLRLAAGLEVLRSWGLWVEVDDQTASRTGYLAGDDVIRTSAAARALTGPSARCWWAARGGYGLQRILSGLPRPDACSVDLVVGFSDVSALHLAWIDSDPRPTLLHAANVTTLSSLDVVYLEATRRAVAEGRPTDFDGLDVVRTGFAEGQVVACNWSILMSMAGTGLLPSMSGRILVVEDVNEAPYRLDRMCWQLGRLARSWNLAGLCFGDLGGAQLDGQLQASLADLADQIDVPAVMGVPIGHGRRNMPVFSGMDAALDAKAGTLQFRPDI